MTEPVSKPLILALDDDPVTLADLARALDSRYSGDYEIVVETAPAAAHERLEALSLQGREVALIISDQWLPGTTGVDFLAQVGRLHPGAQRALLIEWGDRSSEQPILRAMTLDQLDDWIPKPWASPEEWLYPQIQALLSTWAEAHRRRFEAVAIVANQWEPRSHELRDLLERNGIPYGFYPVDSAEARQLLDEHKLDPAQLPVLLFYRGPTSVLAQPSNAEIASVLGASTRPELELYDLAVVGAGPAGLAAAVYGASEGLRTVVIEREALGEQAGTSSRIRNYPGFPRGISGRELTSRAYVQAWLFGAAFIFVHGATSLEVREPESVLRLSDGSELRSRAVILAMGVTYRRLEVPGLERLTGRGVFCGAATTEAQALRGECVCVVGGANSAGQAAMHLAQYAAQVTVLVRGESLAASMSDYLVQDLARTPNITVRLTTRVVGAHGEGRLEALTLEDAGTSTTETVPAAALFVLIGAEPHTQWLPDALARDAEGYVLTGRDLLQNQQLPAGWPLQQPPLLLESSLPGVFAVGDVRHDSIKRVAAAAGEGSTAVRLVHEYLSQLHAGARPAT